MCNMACITFGASALKPEEVRGKRVLEVGSLDVNGSLRPVFAAWGPGEYVGIDMFEGTGVDRICSAEQMVAELGPDSFDVVIATEIIEHVEDWRRVITNIKGVCKPGGIILVTTPSKGFPYHAYPHDFWRYGTEDMQQIFADCSIEQLETSPRATGVFVKARKPLDFHETNLSDVALYSIVARRRIVTLTDDLLRKERRMKFLFEKVVMPTIGVAGRVSRAMLNRL